jgi:deoxyribonuclease-4
MGLEGFRRLLNDPRFDSLPMILETPKTEWKRATEVEVDPLDQENLATLRRLLAGRSTPSMNGRRPERAVGTDDE